MIIRKILVCGLPGTGKSTMARKLASHFKGIHVNADFMRATICKDLDFSVEDRIENARRFRAVCQIIADGDVVAVADFVCPTEETRAAFGIDEHTFVIWMDTKKASSYEDTNKLFEQPSKYNVRICDFEHAELKTLASMLERVMGEMKTLSKFEYQNPTALFLGRYQPLHDGHKALIREGIGRVGQAIVAVRDTYGIEKNPFTFTQIHDMFNTQMSEEINAGKLLVIKIPNITNVFYGREVGYTIEKIDLDASIESISASKIRKEIGLT